MNKLIKKIEEIRGKLEGFRRHSLNEMSTRTKVINPLLEALGWDVGDPDEVEEGYATFDGKFVDYALKINGKPVLFVEAKAMGDPLNDNKAIGQVVGYAANAGIVWCVLTNGAKWQVYRSVEKCPAPDKLVMEFSLDEKENVAISDLAAKLNLLSQEEMAQGTLEVLANNHFIDKSVSQVLDNIMRDPPKRFVEIFENALSSEQLSSQAIKESIARVWKGRDKAIEAPPGPEPKMSALRMICELLLSNTAKESDYKILEKVKKAFPDAKSWNTRGVGYIQYARYHLNSDPVWHKRYDKPKATLKRFDDRGQVIEGRLERKK